jgi:hypothetical protein
MTLQLLWALAAFQSPDLFTIGRTRTCDQLVATIIDYFDVYEILCTTKLRYTFYKPVVMVTPDFCTGVKTSSSEVFKTGNMISKTRIWLLN